MTFGLVIPATAGIPASSQGSSCELWIPAFAGMTAKVIYFQ
jgi:hypothetical protein